VECFVVRQVDTSGHCHTVVLSREMTIELMRHMKAFVRIEL